MKIGEKKIKLVKDDLTLLSADAIVFYAREDLDLGSGYGTSIQMRGGVAIKKELEAIGGVKMGEAVATGAGALKAKYIIHACGPKHLENDMENKLRDDRRAEGAAAACLHRYQGNVSEQGRELLLHRGRRSDVDVRI